MGSARGHVCDETCHVVTSLFPGDTARHSGWPQLWAGHRARPGGAAHPLLVQSAITSSRHGLRNRRKEPVRSDTCGGAGRAGSRRPAGRREDGDGQAAARMHGRIRDGLDATHMRT